MHPRSNILLLLATLAASCSAQQAPSGAPIAIVPVDSAASVTGALEISAGKAMIAASGTVTAGSKTVEVSLPHRGTLRICASSKVNLAADTSVPAGDTPGLVMALDHGALETSFATGQNADILITPDFRILISGSGTPTPTDVKVRLGEHGDTCIDNAGTNAPYVLVTSVFDGGAYRVQPGQRVMFQHGSVHEVVDQEKETCGCPPETRTGTNDFPVAESMGLGNAPPVTSLPPGGTQPTPPDSPTAPLVHQGQPEPTPQPQQPAAATDPTPAPPAPATKPAPKNNGFFHKLGNFFRKLFGSE